MYNAVLLNILNDHKGGRAGFISGYGKDIKLEEKLSGSKALRDTE